MYYVYRERQEKSVKKMKKKLIMKSNAHIRMESTLDFFKDAQTTLKKPNMQLTDLDEISYHATSGLTTEHKEFLEKTVKASRNNLEFRLKDSKNVKECQHKEEEAKLIKTLEDVR